MSSMMRWTSFTWTSAPGGLCGTGWYSRLVCLAAPNGVQAEGVPQQEVQESVLGPAEAEETPKTSTSECVRVMTSLMTALACPESVQITPPGLHPFVADIVEPA